MMNRITRAFFSQPRLFIYRSTLRTNPFVATLRYFSADSAEGKAQEIFEKGRQFLRQDPQDFNEAAKCFEEAAEYVPAAQYNLGVFYLHGVNGKKDPKKAFDLFTLSADKGITVSFLKIISQFSNY